ncbi:MAG: ABC transporter substrate-binding protein [Anaerolineae bacterium]
MMNQKRLTRRMFLRILALVMLSVTVASCAPSTVTVEVTKEVQVKETVIVEGTPEVVEKVVTATPEPTPEMSGQISILWWHDLKYYEEDPIKYSTQYGPPYVMLQEWKEAHPGIEVELISHPIDGTEYQWITTNLIAGTLPDLVMGWPSGDLEKFLEDPENQGLVYDMQEDMQEPNPYGSAPTWEEEFPLPLSLAQGRIPWTDSDSAHFIGQYKTGQQGAVVFYYNKDMFSAAGIEEAPATWADLMDVSEKLKEAGYTAYYADGTKACCSIRWCFDWGFDQLMDPVIQEMARAINPEKADCDPTDTSCLRITDEERSWAVTKGLWRADDPQYLEMVRLMKEWTPYWNEDWLAPEDLGDGGYWFASRVAIWQNGVWALNRVIETEERDFEFGTFAFPEITEESTEYATGAPIRRHGGLTGGGNGNSFFIPTTTVERGNLPIVLDYLQYITSAEAHERFCDYQYPPCVPIGQTVEDVVTDPKELDRLSGFFNPPMTQEHVVRYLSWPGASQDAFNRLFIEYATDRISLEEFGAQLQVEFEREAEKLIAENPGWDTASWPEP